ncbi:MAG TPA: amidohydrolase family protein, partial [Acidimicrobiales bacterium]|nr:amidohydrolase family protein [Acidimicrobiales bacterium]
MTIAGFRVIDCHHHVGSLEAQGFTFAGGGTGADPVTVELERRLASMDRFGVDQAILIPGHGYLRPDGVADSRRVNDGIAAYRDGLPERFPAALGIAEPLHGAAGIAELTRMRDDLGLMGLSVHARFQGVQTDSPLVLNLVRAAANLGLVPFIHAVEGVPDEAIWRVQQVARAIPDTTVVVLDAFGGAEHARQAVHIALETPNLVFDTSLAHHYLFVEAMINAVGHERLVFGTDYYSMMHSPQHAMVLDEL